MSNFVKAVNKAEKQFRKELSELLKKAAQKYQGTCILSRIESKSISSGVPFFGMLHFYGEDMHNYTLKNGHILHEVKPIISHPPEDSKGGPYTVGKLSYREFIKSLSFQELLYVANELTKLGF